jgi:outer membrane lipase/esterase
MSWGIEWRARVAVVVAASCAALTACGGGQQVERFAPNRIVSFGDETSVLVDSGDHNALKYAVNYATAASGSTPASTDCKLFPIWIQALANNYGLVFSECNYGTTPGTQSGYIYAAVGAHSADVESQIQSFLISGKSFSEKDLVTVLAGMHDVLDEYLLVRDAAETEEQGSLGLDAKGTALAAQVNAIAQAGGKVLIVTIPDMGLTPYAVNEGTTNAALLTRLTARFNAKLRIGLMNDGHKIGLVLLDEAVQAARKSTALNTTDVACDTAVALPDCSTLTLSTAITTTQATAPTSTTVSNWLWADDTRMGVYGQVTLGALAVSRATNNPF